MPRTGQLAAIVGLSTAALLLAAPGVAGAATARLVPGAVAPGGTVEVAVSGDCPPGSAINLAGPAGSGPVRVGGPALGRPTRAHRGIGARTGAPGGRSGPETAVRPGSRGPGGPEVADIRGSRERVGPDEVGGVDPGAAGGPDVVSRLGAGGLGAITVPRNGHPGVWSLWVSCGDGPAPRATFAVSAAGRPGTGDGTPAGGPDTGLITTGGGFLALAAASCALLVPGRLRPGGPDRPGRTGDARGAGR
ncbi:hypothetical protein R8Z50_09250 [Longispora sp. K20-0274]|uniref:hypothetical protein n=1 Tax=Longispora sp. K20-0274 TaxID=3088255 RepID=UPI00399C1863